MRSGSKTLRIEIDQNAKAPDARTPKANSLAPVRRVPRYNHCNNGYCSGVCCMYAIKEAVIAKEHAKGDLDAAIFFMDMRTFGKEFEQYYTRAKENGIRFLRSRVHTM